jgi:hypothetical protein
MAAVGEDKLAAAEAGNLGGAPAAGAPVTEMSLSEKVGAGGGSFTLSVADLGYSIKLKNDKKVCSCCCSETGSARVFMPVTRMLGATLSNICMCRVLPHEHDESCSAAVAERNCR